jgi:ubiquitin C-terminal hydrolase
MRDHVWFENVIHIKDNLVSKGLRVGIFNSKHSDKAMLAAQYRLFSVVEHVGEHANRGHYVCHTMDSDDSWRTFDDSKMKSRDLNRILDSTQAYILFYELIQ